MKLFKLYSLLFVMVAVLSFSCNEGDPQTDPTAGLIKITEGYALGAGTKVELWAKQQLFTGYNEVFVALYDSIDKSRITEAHVHLHPLMSMTGGMQHACPAESPEDENAVNKLFPAGIVFIMASSNMGSWKLEIDVHNHHNGKEGSAEFDITVTDRVEPMVKSFETNLQENIFISYNFPTKMKVGINDFVIVAHQKVDMMSFPPVEDLTFVLTPEMPSMGHGSPNNVNPVHDQIGHYPGKVNFTMTGEWRLNLEIRRGGELLHELFFDVTVD